MNNSYILYSISFLSLVPISYAIRAYILLLFGTVRKTLSRGQSIQLRGVRYSYPIASYLSVDVFYGTEIEKEDRSFLLTEANLTFEYNYRSKKFSVTSEVKGEDVFITVAPV